MNININDKVLIATATAPLNSYNGKIAVVKRIYNEVVPPIAYVEIEDFNTDSITGLKVPLTGLVVIPEKSHDETPVEENESEEITITRDEFRNVAARVIAEETKGFRIAAPMFAALVGNLIVALFGKPKAD